MKGRPGSVAEITTQRWEDSERSYDLTTVFLPKINASAELLGLIPGSYQFSKDIYTNGFCSLTDIGLGTLNQEFNFFCLEICTLLGKLGSLSLDSLHACVLVSDSVTSSTIACKAPLSMEFSRQEYWSVLLCLPPEDLLNPDWNLHLLHCRRILSHWAICEALVFLYLFLNKHTHAPLISWNKLSPNFAA